MSIYKDQNWRQKLIENPPKSAQMYRPEEWEYIVLNELTSANVFIGEENGNFGNPTNYCHSNEVREKISKNHSKHWLGKEVPWKGKSRPDAIDIAKRMGKGNIGKDPWNKNKTGLQTHTEETKQKMSLAKKGKPKPKLTCPHCNKTGGAPQMKQWHFDNCKENI